MQIVVRCEQSLKSWRKSSLVVVKRLLNSQLFSVSVCERSLENAMSEKQQKG